MSATVPFKQARYQRHRISVDDFRRMVDFGILAPDERVELIEGEMIDMAPIGSLHASRVNHLLDVLASTLHGRAIVAAQNPIVLGNYSQPQPDLAVLRFRSDYYAPAHPGPEDIHFIIEVADSSGAYDREVKIPLYARHGIPEVWLFDLQEKRLEVYHGPEQGEYRHVDYYRSGTVHPLAFSDLVLDLAALLE